MCRYSFGWCLPEPLLLRRKRHPSTLRCLRASDGERVLRNGFGDRRAGRDEGVLLDGDRCDQVRVAADEAPSLRPACGACRAVVVHDHRAAAEARARADVGVADVREVVGLHARTDLAVLHLDEVADPNARSESVPGAQVRGRTQHHVVADLRGLDDRVRLDRAALADARRVPGSRSPARSRCRGRSARPSRDRSRRGRSA